MFGIARRGAAFLVRQHGQLQGELLGAPIRQGVTRSGTVSEQAMLVYDPCSGEALPLRRLTLALKEPTRDGDTALHLLTNVPAQEARARPLVGVYGKRWTIETAFLELTTTLSCEIRTLGGCPRISTSDPLSCGYACGSYIQMAIILDIIPLCQARVASQEV